MDSSLQGGERVGRITIHSKWLGFGSPPFRWDDSEIIPDGDQFVVVSRNRMPDPPRDKADGPDEEPWVAVPSASVDRLLLSIGKPPLERPSPENLRLDSQVLRPYAKHLAGYQSRLWADDQWRLRRAGFSDEQIADLLCDADALPRSVEQVYRTHWTDDSPEMEVRLRMTGGTEFVLESKSQKHFMLPWWIRRTDTRARFNTFDADVSRALAAILPEGYLNRRVLLGRAGLGEDLAQWVVEGRLWELGRQYKLHRRLWRILARAIPWNRR
jgi:hypothetical protein